MVHRLVAKAFVPPVSGADDVNHIDGNALNNHVSNLEWCTNQENAVHSVAILNRRKWPKALTDEQVREVRRRLERTRWGDRKRVAEEMGLPYQTVAGIARGSRYWWVGSRQSPLGKSIAGKMSS